MGVRLRNTFYSIDGVTWQMDIHDTSYSSAVQLFDSAPPGFELKYSGDKERYDPIFASECSVYALAQGAVVEDLITDIAAATEGRFFLRLYKNSTLYWSGKLLSDKIKKEDIYYPYAVNITFTDGIGALKDIYFSNSGILYTGREDFIGIICKILTKTGIADLFGADDNFLKTCVHWYDAHHNFYANWDPLKYTDIYHESFYNYDETTGNQAKKCWEVLEEILITFGCHIKQCAGVFQIIQPNEYINNYLMTRTYSKTGTQLSYNYYENYRTAIGNYTRLTGGIYSYYPPLFYVSRKYNYKQSSLGRNILPVLTAYNPAVAFLSDIAGSGTEFLKFYGIVNEIFTFSEYQDPFFAKYRVDVIITKGDGTKQYMYNGANGDAPPSWSANSAHYMTFWSASGLHPKLFYNAPFPIQFNSALNPWDATGTFRFQLLGLYDDIGGAVYVPTGTYSYTFTCLDFLMELMYGAQLSGEGMVFFKAENITAGNKSKILELAEAFIGDGPNRLSLGRLKTYDGSTWINSTLWGIKSSPKTRKIHQLLVDEVLLGQQVPADIFEGNIYSTTYSAEKCLVFADDSIWVPLNVVLNGNDDVWKGQFWKMKLATASPQIGLTLSPGNYDPLAEWYLQAWDSEPLTETEIDENLEINQTEGALQENLIALTGQAKALQEIMSIAYLSTAITAGSTLEIISVGAIMDKLLASGDQVKIISPAWGFFEILQLAADQGAGDMKLTIESHTFENDYPKGSRIIFNMYDLLKKIFDT